MALLKGTKGLENWCKVVVDGHPGVNIVNMTTSWRNGMGFCAIIHHFRPELIDFESLGPDDVYGNNLLAFSVAEQHIGIPALLDPQDMVECELLDRLSILTYLSQFYQAFHGATTPAGNSSAGSSKPNSSCSSPVKSGAPAAAATRTAAPVVGRKSEPCRVCGKAVFILERLNVSGRLLHRTCFKCARCSAQLSVANYYETEGGDYCCDVCPDEEANQEKAAEANKKLAEVAEMHLVATPPEGDVYHEDVSHDGSSDSSSEGEDDDEEEEGEEEHGGGEKGGTISTSGSVNNSVDDVRVAEVPFASIDGNDVDNARGAVTERRLESLSIVEKVSCNEEETDSRPESPSSTVGAKDVIIEGGEDPKPLSERPSTQVAVADEGEEEGKCKLKVRCEEDDKREGEGATPETSSIHVSVDAESRIEKNTTKYVEDGDENDHSGDERLPLDTEQPKDGNEAAEQAAAKDVAAVDAETAAEEESSGQSHEANNPFVDVTDEDENEGEKEVPVADVPTREPDPSVPSKRVSTNPFSSDLEDSGEEGEQCNLSIRTSAATPGPPPPKPPRVSLNPFGSDFEDDEEEEDGKRSSRLYPVLNSPVSSTGSRTPTSARRRKKRQAPLPPRTSPAPIPSPRSGSRREGNGGNSPVPAPRTTVPHRPAPPRPPLPSPPTPTDVSKSHKDRENQNRRSMLETSSIASLSDSCSVVSTSTTTSASTATPHSQDHTQHLRPPPPPPPTTTTLDSAPFALTRASPDKATEGQWKKKKGPAPPRPIPAKRQVRKLPRKSVNQELHDIEVKQQEMERQGVSLEKMIRDLCNQNDAERTEAGLDNSERDSLGPEAEDLIIQMFELVNEKNDLFRRQTILLSMKREHRLEEEHADIEHQIRVLMAKPDALRTDDDKELEEKLIQRLMVTVTQRNEIVDCLEMDRLRALEEDESIEIHMEEYAAVKPVKDEAESKKKKKKKERKKKKKNKGYDADKDVDTKEFPNVSSSATSSPSKSSPAKKKLTFVSPLSMSRLSDKEKTRKLRKKILSSLNPISNKKSS